LNEAEMGAKITELEGRIAKLPDWKKKYEDEHDKLEAEHTQVEAIRGYLQQAQHGLQWLFGNDIPNLIPSPDARTMNLQEQQTVVNISHEEKPVNLTTNTVVGKILYVALTELKDGFTSEELMAHLAEHGWPIGPNTISPTVGGMVKNGSLVRLPDTKPPKFRTPMLVKFNVTEV